MTTEEHIEYWQKLAKADLTFAKELQRSGENLHYCLFFGHLSLERLFKALIVAKTRQTPPKTHDLIKLARTARLQLTQEQKERLDEFNSFNLEASNHGDFQLAGKSVAEKIKQDIINLAARLQMENIHIQRAILFGSFASGAANELSDIDIALISPDFAGIRYLDNRRIAAAKLAINEDFETHPFTPQDFADSPFAQDEILRHGVEIELPAKQRKV